MAYERGDRADHYQSRAGEIQSYDPAPSLSPRLGGGIGFGQRQQPSIMGGGLLALSIESGRVVQFFWDSASLRQTGQQSSDLHWVALHLSLSTMGLIQNSDIEKVAAESILKRARSG